MTKEKKYKIVIAAGGTGGHIFPAIALAKKFRVDGHKVILAGTGNELEKKIFSEHDFETEYFESRLKGSSTIKKFFLSLRKNKEIKSYLEKNNPDLILGMGGYASSEFCLAAQKKTCVIIHEQNSIAGRTNRFLIINRSANAAIEGLPDSFTSFIKFLMSYPDDLVYLGNPVRDEILNIQKTLRPFPDKLKKPRIFIMGGSQGARSINMAVPEAINLLSQDLPMEVIHDAGENDFDVVNEKYIDFGIDAEVTSFNTNIEKAYEWADLLIGRAGAMTVSETSAIGLPSILIPFPYALDNHQLFNAQFLEKKGGALIIKDKDLNPKVLAAKIQSIFKEQGKLEGMSDAAFDKKFVDATVNIVKFCYKTIEKHQFHNDYPNQTS
ncbi:MAG: undecaprenyldiphospho-muramoylpentapeptide beta-N-acetylglucosaminyltransferase [Gammaproteobacteria bacterium]|nr:undecaprenyldiphospho-muramoylpentapeptide beta-N-acetylglucosaminyltransferase [Gammaproteobacteria bacterium]